MQLFMRAGKCSRAKPLLINLTGRPTRTSHVASTTLKIRSPNGHRKAVDWRKWQSFPHTRGEVYIDVYPSDWPNLLHFNRRAVVPAHR
jgi:hypothetical protein